jgi:hypothetical protein
MRDADGLGGPAGVVDVDAGAAGLGFGHHGAVIVKLQGDADDVIAFGLHQRGDDRAVDTAGHGDDNARILRAAGQVQTVSHFSKASRNRYRPRAPAVSRSRVRTHKIVLSGVNRAQKSKEKPAELCFRIGQRL